MVDKPRFSANDLMFMPWNQIVYKIVQNKQTLPPAQGVVEYAKRKTLDEVVESQRAALKKSIVKFKRERPPKKTVEKQGSEREERHGGYSVDDLERELSQS